MPCTHRPVMRDIASAFDSASHGALRALRRLVDRMINIRVDMLNQHIIRPRERDTERTTSFDAVLNAMQILKHHINALNARLKMTQRRGESLTRVLIDMLTVI